MEKVVLNATRRAVIGKQVKALRREGKLPAVIYGRNFEMMPISLDQRETSRSLSHVGMSTLLSIQLEGIPYTVLVREKQRNSLTGELIHIDFQAISMTEKLRASVVIDLGGIAPAVKDFNALLVTNLSEIEVECLPSDLPERMVVDVSNLKSIGDVIHVRDLVISPNIRLLEDPDTIIVVVNPAEEELVIEEGVSLEPEVIEKGKKEEEEF
jgi:large subunit ribosomal protein L25